MIDESIALRDTMVLESGDTSRVHWDDMTKRSSSIGVDCANIAFTAIALAAYSATTLTVTQGFGADTEILTRFQFIQPLATEGPEPRRFTQSDPNDIRDIAIIDNGFLVATGAGIIRYEYFGEIPKAAAVYTHHDGLPTGNCYLLRCDADGGVWALCRGGVGYLPQKSDRWQAFTQKDGLATGCATGITLSANGSRVWICSDSGLSTTLVRDRNWEAFTAERLVEIAVHPSKDIVWCRLLDRSGCDCGRYPATWQFELGTRSWRKIPQGASCPHSYLAPFSCCFAEGILWISGGSNPPAKYDLQKNVTQIWPKQPNWERVEGNQSDAHRDTFGAIMPALSGEPGIWLATSAGIWRFDQTKDEWQAHIRNHKPQQTLYSRSLLATNDDGKTLFRACNGAVAAYDVAARNWTDLWHIKPRQDFQPRHSLGFSPDGKMIWLFGSGGILVGEPASKQAIRLDDDAQPGLSDAKFVRFDPSKKRALIATPEGVIGADYDGTPKFSLSRPIPPIRQRVQRIITAPDSSEVWCVMSDTKRGEFPAVLFPQETHWELSDDPDSSGRFIDMAFSTDGKKVWLCREWGVDSSPEIVQRSPGSRGWDPCAVKIPDGFTNVTQMRVTPNNEELWLGSSEKGLLRIKLTNGEITQYFKEFDHRCEGVQHGTLSGDCVDDLSIDARGRFVICSAGDNDEHGITVIDLKTGRATNHSTGKIGMNKVIVSPDGKTIWCKHYGYSVWALDLQTHSWTHKFSNRNEVHLNFITSVECSPDGEFVWLSGTDGLAVYCATEKSWKRFLGSEWSHRLRHPLLSITADGQHALCCHEQGVAVLTIDGSELSIIPVRPGIEDCYFSDLLPIPQSGDYICAVTHPEVGGLYYVEVKNRSMRKLKNFRDSTVSAMTIGTDGCVWGAAPGELFCVNSKTGRDRDGFESLLVGRPRTKLLHPDKAPGRSEIEVAPKPAMRGRVMSRPENMPQRPKATSLRNQGLASNSSQTSCVAVSGSGSTYVTWPANSTLDPVEGRLPQIPRPLFPRDQHIHGASGISLHDGQQWLPPQVLRCDIQFAWCQQDDLHVLVATGVLDDRLFHFRYRPSSGTWSKLSTLDHRARSFCADGETVHMAGIDSESSRICYRRYDGKEWSTPVWIEANEEVGGLAIAAGIDGIGHLVWEEGRAFVAHASVTKETVEYSRQDFSERPIAGRHFDVTSLPNGSLVMAHRAVLYDGHSDVGYPHLRTWHGQSWSEPTVIPFDSGEFEYPQFVQYGNTTLLSWVGSSSSRVFSVLGPENTWSYPLPVCSTEEGMSGCRYSGVLHADRQGSVHAAWYDAEETRTVVVTTLAK